AALADYEGKDKDGEPFAAIEAIGEGVRLSSLEFALHANLIAVLRPKVEPEHVRTAIVRALALRGTPYDFSFDLSSQDKIICTELVYRAYAPHLEGPLEEVMGRKTLKPDGMLRTLDPTLEKPLADYVVYGASDAGKLQVATVEELMKTVSPAP
ncbi:MAG: YiiX/YebB-like N1pC/P60 family cysteine hydrolase, partial [Myxococcota bacterium]|nr:YiiX/YebB-like N1pC/P60 family cysteine hydrolase [Myxococcota bacterium]